MSSSTFECERSALERLGEIAQRIAMRGDFADVDDLLALAGSSRQAPEVAALAESFARIVVQLEAREFRLECMIEDLLQVKTELEQANYDALTGLPNRVIFRDRLRQALALSRRNGTETAVFFLDLNRFKWVNDNLGHAAGDQLLQRVSERLRGCVRESDTLARLGGDEFTCAQPDIASREHAFDVARRFIDCLSTPFVLDSGPVQIGTSIGLAFFPEHGDDPDILIGHADAAMYRAKARQGSAFAVHGG